MGALLDEEGYRPAEGFTAEPVEQAADTASGGNNTEPDLSAYDGATLRLISPLAGEVLLENQTVRLAAELVAADGTRLDASSLVWTSDQDPTFLVEGDDVEVDLPVGVHRLLARMRLPNGDGLAVSVGEVRVQARATGIYAGLFEATVVTLGLPFSCVGATEVTVGPYGTEGTGTGSCLLQIPLISLDLPLDFQFDLDVGPTGEVGGTAAAEILFILYRFPATGTCDPEGAGFQVDFSGEIPLVGSLNAGIDAPRLSLDY